MQPDEGVAVKDEGSKSHADKPSKIAQQWGLVVQALPADEAKELRIKGGVKVVSVDGPAARAGLKAGDVIFALSNTDVGTVNEFEGLLSKADTKKPLSVMFRRGDWAQYTLIRPER